VKRTRSLYSDPFLLYLANLTASSVLPMEQLRSDIKLERDLGEMECKFVYRIQGAQYRIQWRDITRKRFFFYKLHDSQLHRAAKG
jgi:hypothetical protein